MRIANLQGRGVILTSDALGADVYTASGGVFGPDLPSIFGRWEEFVEWAVTDPVLTRTDGGVAIDRVLLDAPSPAPRQIFGIGLNYSAHAAESGYAEPAEPPVFTKFVTSIGAPDAPITLPDNGNTDWEVELVVVIGREAYKVDAAAAWSYVAGLCIGQDISERRSQLAGPVPQFSLGKSFPGFAPFGPWLVTVDEFVNPDDLELGCSVDGEEVQRSRTGDLVVSVPKLIAYLSRTLPLLPGDVIFTGTPAGVGLGCNPPRYLKAGQTLTTWIEGIGEIKQVFVSESAL